MSDRDPSVEMWAEGMRRLGGQFGQFGQTLAEFGQRFRKSIAESIAAHGMAKPHSVRAHLVIREELTACVLGARKRPELEGDFDDPTEM